MKTRAADFTIPSLVAHALVGLLLMVTCFNTPSMKSLQPQPVRVNLMQAPPPPPPPPPAPAPAPASAPQAQAQPKAEKPKPQPKVEKPPEQMPEQKTEPMKEIKQVEPEHPKAEKTVLPTPKAVKEKQQTWRKQQDKLVKRVITNEPPHTATAEPPQSEKPIKRTQIAAVQLESQKAFDKYQKTLSEIERQQAESRAERQQRLQQGGVPGGVPGGVAGGVPGGTVGGVAGGTIGGVAGGTVGGVLGSFGGGEEGAVNAFFRNSILTAIDRVWAAPSAALVPKAAQCVIGFRLDRSGRVSAVHVVRSSGFGPLDESGKAAVEQASFAAFPADINQQVLDVEVPFEVSPKE